jgi:hypothetical protein
MMATDAVPPKITGPAAEAAALRQEAVMGQAIPRQHPAVVLRSHFNLLRGLLAVAMIALVGLTVAVVILATNDREPTDASSATAVTAPPQAGIRYDGGPEEGTAAASPSLPRVTSERSFPAPARDVNAAQAAGQRYDGGPEEGTAAITQRSAPATFDPNSIKQPPGVRYDGGPEEGTAAASPAQPRVTSERSFPGPPSETTGAQPDGLRYDGGPDEGSSGVSH